jgi:hypothetical protein
MKYSGLIRAASSAATGNHINRGRFSFAGAHHPTGSPRLINPDLQEDRGRGSCRGRAGAKFRYPYTVRYANLNKYVAVALSVPNCFEPFDRRLKVRFVWQAVLLVAYSFV